ncbi:hypothetical protein SLE2022_060130 [Rubroshorea leprosula]
MMKFSILYILVLFVSLSNPSSASDTTFNVLNFGAIGNGVTNSTQAFLDAWSAACGSPSSTLIYLPKGRYLLGSMILNGGCKSPGITIMIDGTLVAPVDYHALGSYWLSFLGVSGVSIIGGALDAKGSALWACKKAASMESHNPCPDGATSLGFTNSSNITIKGLMSLNSQLYHIVINSCQNVAVEGVTTIAAGDSPNTDGIHVQLSSYVQITNCIIKTGDDCISIGPGTENLWIEHVICGPGHGISIGSLGKNLKERGVKNVTAKQTIFVGSQNGLRIKSWARPSSGFVQGIRFLGAIMKDVQNPILIDQNYCPHNISCPEQASGVRISDVLYQGIRGTSATPVAIKFDCSVKNPCMGIRLQNVDLAYFQTEMTQSFCANAVGKVLGLIRPNSCL